MSTAEVSQELTADMQGLSDEEAARRRLQFGPNALPHLPPPTLWSIALRQFKSPLIYVLGIAAVVALALGEVKDAAFIVGVLVINAIIGTIQEGRAERASQALQKLLRIQATVRRNTQTREIDAEDLVPGDLIYLESGGRVPADIRLFSTHGLEVDESLLTGESMAVNKDANWTGGTETPLADRHNMVFAGSMVIRGRCQGLAAATGPDSAVGRLALDVMQSTGGRPPLVLRMEEFTRRIATAVLIAAAFVAVAGVTFGGYSIAEMFLFGVALAVSAIPEGLPVALTVALAIGTTRMARRGVIVRRLTAVEGLGSCTLIASDKTGTLTCNELTVRQVRLPDGSLFDVAGEGFVPEGRFLQDGEPIEPDQGMALAGLARVAVLCNEADLHHRDAGWTWRGDATDIALLTMAYKLGWRREVSLERHPQINELPFEAERQFAASYHRTDEGVSAMVKGAPERIFEMCDDEPERMSELREMSYQMAEQGYRVLALAEGRAPADLERNRCTTGALRTAVPRAGGHDRPAARGGARRRAQSPRRRCRDHHGHRRPSDHGPGHRPRSGSGIRPGPGRHRHDAGRQFTRRVGRIHGQGPGLRPGRTAPETGDRRGCPAAPANSWPSPATARTTHRLCGPPTSAWPWARPAPTSPARRRNW